MNEKISKLSALLMLFLVKPNKKQKSKPFFQMNKKTNFKNSQNTTNLPLSLRPKLKLKQ